MAKRIIKPTKIKLSKAASQKRAEEILRLIRSRNPINIFREYPTEPERASPSADDWQRFKRDFVEEYGHERVEPTGMTHSEFFDYFKNGRRECEPPKRGKLAEWLKEMDDNVHLNGRRKSGI